MVNGTCYMVALPERWMATSLFVWTELTTKRHGCKIIWKKNVKLKKKCSTKCFAWLPCFATVIKNSPQCMVYSFGINNDWSFEDFMDNSGCTVHGFDHTVNFPSRRGTNTHFYKLGLGSRSAQMKPLSDILKMWVLGLDDSTAYIDPLALYRNGHQNTTIDYLKVPAGSSSL